MIDVSEHNIGIDRLDFYIPDTSRSVIDYCETEPEPFSIEAMNAIWKSGFFDPGFQHRFFSNSTGGSNINFARPNKKEAAEFVRRVGVDRFYCAGEETASDMAVKVVKRLLDGEPEITKEIGMVIHYYSTLNEKLCSTTPARLLHEADLKGAFGFSVGQKNGNACLIAMKIAAETLIAEPHLKSVLLAGSDKLVPPYERVFGKLTITGDSASAMVVRRGAERIRFLAFNTADFPEWWNPYQYSEEQARVLEKFLAENSLLLVDETLRGLGIDRRDVALFLPPNLNLSFARLLISKGELQADRVYTRNISRYGHLMASDPVINLNTALAEGAVKKHDIVLTLGIGLGQSIGCVALEV